MHKDGKWAKQILSLQEPDGKWGCFHSLSRFYASPITTEQALRRLERLGFTMGDECIQKAVCYMDSCLSGKQTIPDRREKLHDWDLFSSLMLSTWIRRFTGENPNANAIAHRWAGIITHAFSSGTYDHSAYVSAYWDTWGSKPNGGRLIDFVSFYQISMLRGCLDSRTELALLDYVLDQEDGIYYVYDKKLKTLPGCFESREASRYLGAVELLAGYPLAGGKLEFVRDWLLEKRMENGMWDMGKTVNDMVYFPLSDDWRRKGARAADCTERLSALVNALTEERDRRR